MGRVLSTESRMERELRAEEREARMLRLLAPVEWALAAFFLVLGIISQWRGEGYHFLAFCALITFVCLGHRLKALEFERDRKGRQAGRRGERQVAALLAEHLPDQHYIINDATIRVGRKNAQFDHVVIAPNGVFALETKFWSGHVDGHANALYWNIHRDNRKKRAVRNPFKQCRRQADVLRAFLRNTPWSHVNVSVLLVSVNERTEWHIQEADIPILSPHHAIAHIVNEEAPHPLPDPETGKLAQWILQTHEK